MNYIQDLELMKVYKEKMYLPHNKSEKYLGTALFSLGSSIKDISEIFNNDHGKLINIGNLYKTYYYDHIRLRQGVKSQYVKNSGKTNVDARSERFAIYDEIVELSPQVNTPLNVSTGKGFNTIYDLEPIVSIIKTHPKLENVTPINKIKAYLDTIFSEFESIKLVHGDKTFKNYMMVNLDTEKGDIGKEFMTSILYTIKNFNRFVVDKKFIYSKDMDVLFFSKKGYFIINLSKIDKGDYNKILKLIKMISNVKYETILDDKNDVKAQVVTKLVKFGFTGDVDDEVVDKIADTIDDGDVGDEELEKIINDNDEIKKELANNLSKQPVTAVSKRDALLREKQAQLKIGDKTIGELLGDEESTSPVPITENKVTQMKTTNENMKKIRFHNFEEDYMKNTYEKDVAAMFTAFNDKSINMNILSVEVTDTSTPLTLKETYRVVYEDEKHVRHTIKVSLPKYIDNKFLYVNGNKKVINKQLAPLPIIKTGPDEVQICSNYNKIFIRRMGNKISPDTERFKKLINDEEVKDISIVRGNNTVSNRDFITNLEYDELAKDYDTIKTSTAVFMFGAKAIHDKFNGKEMSTDEKILIGYTIKDNKPIYLNVKDVEHPTIISKIVEHSKPETQAKFESYTFGQKYIHSKATIMAKNIPLVILLCYFEGLSTVIRKLNCSDVSYSDKKDKGNGYNYIKFADGYLCYPYSNMEAALLLNGLSEIKTQAYTFEEMDSRETYLDIFESLIGTAYIAGALINYYDFMLCPTSVEILTKLNLPTDIVSLMIYANKLLSDNDFTDDIDMKLYRLRSNEIVCGILYKQLTVAYQKYRNTANNPNPVKMSMDENAVIKEIMALPTVEDYSTLNPIVEISKLHLVSTKGYVGMNLDRAYTEQKRSYHDSMLGIIGISTDTGPNCGKVRHLTTEPTVIDTRGFMVNDNLSNLDSMKDTNLFTPAEELTPLGATHDNATRTAMATKQSSHMVAVKSPCPVLISTGMEESIHYRTSNDFSVVAKQDGVITKIDEKNSVMVVTYKDGSIQFVDISSRIAKNGGGGFYILNKLTPSFKEGAKFKKDDILASDSNYYKDDKYFGNRLCLGALIKVATFSNYATYEDSSFITNHMSEELASDFIMGKHVAIGKNASVDYIAKVGQKVQIGDELIRFESSYDESELNKLLANVRDDLKEEIVSSGKTKIKSKYDGEVVDIKVYSTVDLEELSPTIKKIVKEYQDKQKNRRKMLDSYDKSSSESVYRNGILLDAPDTKVDTQYGKVKGIEVGDGVLIEFKIKYVDRLGVGDKVTMFTANKNTVGYVVPQGFEPYTLFRPYEEISTPLAPSAILQRGTPSVQTTSLGNKVLVELKRGFFEIITGMNYNDFMKEELDKKNKQQKAVKESNHQFDMVREKMESLYRLDSVDDMYVSTKYYSSGDIIAADIDEEYTTESLTDFVGSSSYNNCILLENGTFIATKDIAPGETFVVKY